MVSISGVVTTRADGLSVPGAVVSAPGATATTTTDSAGRYLLQVPRTAVRADRIRVVARYGEFCSFTLSPADDQVYAAKWLTDVAVSYQTAGYTLAVGAPNLFGVFPDRNTAVNSFNGIQTFPSQSPFGMNGRAIYARIGRAF